MSNTPTHCKDASTNDLVEAKDLLFFELTKLSPNDQLRVILSAHQTASKLAKLSPEQRATTKIHGAL